MKLKEIKPGMVIHCENDEEKAALEKELARLTYGRLPQLVDYQTNNIVFYISEGDGINMWHGLKSAIEKGDAITEFSDLILPETMTEEEAYKKGREDAFEEVKNCETYGYDCGLKDAWELAKKIALNTHDGGIDAKELEAIFGVQDSYTIFKENDVKEALAKFEEYEEEKKIKVGDVVEYDKMGIHIVTHVNTDEDTYTLINYEGRATFARRKQINKTGKNYGVIETILAEIGSA